MTTDGQTVRADAGTGAGEAVTLLRPAVVGDLPGLPALYRHLHPDDPALSFISGESVWTRLLATEGMTVFVAEVDEKLVATCTLVIVSNLTHGAAPYGFVENVVTHADRRAGTNYQHQHLRLRPAHV